MIVIKCSLSEDVVDNSCDSYHCYTEDNNCDCKRTFKWAYQKRKSDYSTLSCLIISAVYFEAERVCTIMDAGDQGDSKNQSSHK